LLGKMNAVAGNDGGDVVPLGFIVEDLLIGEGVRDMFLEVLLNEFGLAV